MPWAHRPRRIDELVVKRLLHVLYELRLAVNEVQSLDIDGSLPYPFAVTLADRCGDVALERCDQFRRDMCHRRDWFPANAMANLRSSS